MIATVLAFGAGLARYALWILAYFWIVLVIPIMPDVIRRDGSYSRKRDIQAVVMVLGWLAIGWILYRHVIPEEINPFCRGCSSPLE